MSSSGCSHLTESGSSDESSIGSPSIQRLCIPSINSPIRSGNVEGSPLISDAEFSASTPNSVDNVIDDVGDKIVIDAPFSPVTAPPPDDQLVAEEINEIREYLEFLDKQPKPLRVPPESDSRYKLVFLEPKEKVAFPGTNIYGNPTAETQKTFELAVKAIQLGAFYPKKEKAKTENNVRILSRNHQLCSGGSVVQIQQAAVQYDPIPPILTTPCQQPPVVSNVWNFQQGTVTGQNLVYTTPKSVTMSTQSFTKTTVSNSTTFADTVAFTTATGSPPTSMSSFDLFSEDQIEEMENSGAEIEIIIPGESSDKGLEKEDDASKASSKSEPPKSSKDESSGYASLPSESKRPRLDESQNTSVYQHLYQSQPNLSNGGNQLGNWSPQDAFFYQSSTNRNITCNAVDPSSQELKSATMFSASSIHPFAVHQQQQYYNRVGNQGYMPPAPPMTRGKQMALQQRLPLAERPPPPLEQRPLAYEPQYYDDFSKVGQEFVVQASDLEQAVEGEVQPDALSAVMAMSIDQQSSFAGIVTDPQDIMTHQEVAPLALAPNNQSFGNSSAGSVSKKPRTIFSDTQCAKMREVFNQTPYITKETRQDLAAALDISPDVVAVWFKNQRSKIKKLSSGWVTPS